MKKKFISLLIAITLLTPSYAFASIKPGADNPNGWKDNYEQCIVFENEGDFNNWKDSGDGSLKLSEAHFKQGKKSMYWEWKKSSKLTVTEPLNIVKAGESKNGGVKAWIYNEDPNNGKLTFNIGSENDINNNDPIYTFDFNLNFKGWRAFWIHFKEDAKNKNYKGDLKEPLKIMEVIPSESVPSGNVFFDIVEFSDNIPWNRTPDKQTPITRTTFNDGKGGTWDRSLYYDELFPTIPLKSTITSDEIKAFKTIQDRYEKWVYGDMLNLSKEPVKIRHEALQEFIKDGVKKYDTLNIKRDKDGNITGLPLFSSRSPHGPEFGKTVSTDIFLPLIFDYKINGNVKSKEKVLDLFDYFNDQGWASGSSIESLDHECNRASGYCHAVYLMRKELKETGRLSRELDTLKWYTNFGRTFAGGDDEITADDMRTKFMYKLLYVMALDDSPIKTQYMKGLVEWMNEGLQIAPGFSCTIKPDYMGFHHRGAYANAYTPQGYHLASALVYLLHDTEFAISKESKDNLKNALLNQRIICNKYDAPIGVRGRFPDNTDIINRILPSYAYLALSEKNIDKEMAEVFMRLWEPNSKYLKEELFSKCRSGIEYFNTLGAAQLMVELSEKGYKAEKAPQGNWFKPYGALSIHRRDNWMVSTKGWSQYIWDFECGNFENMFGRYSSYGSIQILSKGDTIDSENNGYTLENGWDWNRFPGTTTKHLDLKELQAPKLKGKTIHRGFTDETFVGGLSLEGKNGMFSMKLHDTVYDTSFRANKSVFYFNNEVICLGSNIQNNDKANNTETTLFQSGIKDAKTPCFVNSNVAVTDANYSYEVKENEKAWLVDPYNNGYVIKNASGLHIERKEQTSLDDTSKKPTKGFYTTAWLDHGKNPKNSEYEYSILVDTNAEKVKKYAESEATYKVIQKDDKAHILHHKGENTTAYALFDENTEIKEGVLKNVTSPCMVMIKDNKNKLVLSMTDPDLKMPKLKNMEGMPEEIVSSPSVMKKVKLELKGQWNMPKEATNARVLKITKDTTTVEFDCVDGKTIEVNLEQYKK